MRLHDLLDATEVLEIVHGPSGDAATTDVSDVTHDSRATHPGALFCCIPGLHVDGHEFAAVAVDRGAVALMSLGLGIFYADFLSLKIGG